MNGATNDFFNENGGIDHTGLLASTTTSATSIMATNGTTTVNTTELTNEYRLKSGARTTETTLYFDLTNKENFQNGYFDDEPMDVDMSMNAPGTPATNHISHHTNFNRSSNRPSSEVLQISPTNTNTRCIDPSPNSLQHAVKPTGPKIIKPIRPAGIVKPVIKPAVARQDELGDGEEIDSFKSRPKLYSGTSSASSISANEAFDEEQHQQRQQPPVYHQNQPMSDLNTINSVSLSNNHLLNPFQLKSDMLSMPGTSTVIASNNKSPSPRSATSSQNNLGSFGNLSNNEEFNDEWETHKKRSSKSKSSAGNSPQRSQSTRLSGENQHHLSHQTTAAAGKFESMGHVNTGRRSFGDGNGITDSDGFESSQPVDFLQATLAHNPVPPVEATAVAPIQEDKESLLFNSIFTNENDFQTFLDLLEKKEVDESKENLQRYSEFARQSLYVQFDPILQKSNLSADKLKRLSLIRDRKEAIKNYLSEINEEAEENTAVGQNSKEEIAEKKSVFCENENKCQRADNSSRQQHQQEVLVAVYDDERPIEKKMMANDEIAVGGSGANRFTLDDHDDQLENSHDIDHVISDIKSSSYAADVKHQQRLSMNETSKAASITPDRTSLGKTNGGSVGHHASIERSPSNENANKLLDDFDSSLKLDNNNSIMTTSSYSNKTNDLINRSQYWLEKSNYGKVGGSEPTAASLTNGAAVNGASSGSSKVVEATPQPQQQTSTAPTPSAENYNDLVNELNRMKQNEENYQNTIFDLRRNQQEFFQIVVDFEEALKTAEQDKVDIEDKLNKEINELTRERDNLQMDVIGLENANKDFQRRFDIVRERIEEFKENEKKLYDALQLSKQQTEKEKVKYAQLRKQAEEKLNSANVEIDKLRNSTSIEIQTLKAELRKAEIKISSMEKSLQQKENENTELTNLLDELLAKVKPPNS